MNGSPIERYLAELARELPRIGRRRVLTEAEDHLREAAPTVGEEEAVARFGPAHDFARSLAPLARAVWLRLSAVAAMAVPLSFVASYPVYENELPPAPWPSAADMPAYLAWKREAIVFLALAVVVASVGALLARRRAAAAGLAVVCASLAALLTIFALQWHAAVPGTPDWLLALALVHASACAVPAALAVPALRGCVASTAWRPQG